MPANERPTGPAAGRTGAGRVLVLRPGAIGDTLVTLPALAALRRAFPAAEIVVAGNAACGPLVATTGLVDRWLSFDHPAVTRLFVPGAPAATDPFGDLVGAVAWCGDPAGLLAAALRARGAAAPVVAPSRPRPEQAVHVACHLVRTLAPILPPHAAPPPGGPAEPPPFDLPPAALEQAEAVLRAAGLDQRRFLTVHPGSGSSAKNWPVERFAEVMRAVRDDHDLASLVLVGPADEPVGRRLRALLPDAALVADAPLTVVAALLRRARCHLGNDSGPAHLAGLLGRPTLALFGPTDPVHWRPLGPRVRALRAEPLTDLSVGGVLDALRSLAPESPAAGEAPTVAGSCDGSDRGPATG